MKTSDAIAYFGDKTGLAAAVGVALPSVYGWGEFPPRLRQFQLEALTAGALKAEPDCDKFRPADPAPDPIEQKAA